MIMLCHLLTKTVLDQNQFILVDFIVLMYKHPTEQLPKDLSYVFSNENEDRLALFAKLEDSKFAKYFGDERYHFAYTTEQLEEEKFLKEQPLDYLPKNKWITIDVMMTIPMIDKISI